MTDKYTDSKHTARVPCGKCHKCLGRRRNNWAFRLYHEMLVSESAVFMTLTYGVNEKEGWGENPPTSFNGIYTLHKPDLQKFFKRLRKINNGKLRYYAVGEYGSDNKRPHYHIILFNLDSKHITNSLSISKNVWQKGNVDIASCNIATINYTCGYIMQGVWSPETDDDDRNPHFSVMSKHLGASYLTEAKYNYHLDRLELSADHPSGFKISLPRYYRDKIFSRDEKAEIYELNSQINKMDWDEFINYDYDMENQQIADQIRRFNKNQKLKRCTL